MAKRKTTTGNKASWVVRMRCVVTKEVMVEKCTEEQARNEPWEHASDETEIEQIDWEVLFVTPNE